MYYKGALFSIMLSFDYHENIRKPKGFVFREIMVTLDRKG